MTNLTVVMLVCVYYRVAAGDAPRVIPEVREFQRTLRPGTVADGAEVLLRCDLPLQASSFPPPDARPAFAPSQPDRVDPDADATVMETYRLTLPAAAGPDADAVVGSFLAALETASRPVARFLRGARHVELFAPCAS